MSRHSESVAAPAVVLIWTVSDNLSGYGQGTTPEEAAQDFGRRLESEVAAAQARIEDYRKSLATLPAPLPPQ